MVSYCFAFFFTFSHKGQCGFYLVDIVKLIKTLKKSPQAYTDLPFEPDHRDQQKKLKSLLIHR